MKVADQKSRPSSRKARIHAETLSVNRKLLGQYGSQSRPGKSQQEDLQYDDTIQVFDITIIPYCGRSTC